LAGGVAGFVPINSQQYYIADALNYCYPMNPNWGIGFFRNDTTISYNNTLYALGVFGICPEPGVTGR
jgi:hypothetical protein